RATGDRNAQEWRELRHAPRTVPTASVPFFDNRLRFGMSPVTAASVEFETRRRLRRTDAPGCDVGDEVIFAPYRRSGQTSQQRDLPDVGEGVGDRCLEQALRLASNGRAGSEAGVETAQAVEEARHVQFPGPRRRVVPVLPTIGERQRPVQQVADMREYLRRR